MKSKYCVSNLLFNMAVAVFFAAAPFSRALTITRTLHIETTPPGANVTINGKDFGPAPVTAPKVDIKTDVPAEITLTKEGFETQKRVIKYDEAKQKERSETWKLAFDLVEVQRRVIVEVTCNATGASVFINNKLAGTAPLTNVLLFSRAGKDDKWNSNSIRVEKDKYSKDEKVITFEETKPEPLNDLKYAAMLAELRREIPFEVKANVPEAVVTIDGKDVGKTPTDPAQPLKTTLIFQRATGAATWPQLKMEIQKEGFEYRTADSTPTNIFTKALSVEAAAVGKLEAGAFLPARYVLAPLRTFEVEGTHTSIARTNVHSAVSLNEGATTPTQITTAPPDAPLVFSRISCGVYDNKEQIAFSMPVREERAPGAPKLGDAEIVGANIWMQVAGAPAQGRITEGRYFDIDPFITRDGKIYYSSDRFGGRCICRQVIGRPARQKVTGQMGMIDREPAESPDGQKLAYTSQPVNAPPGTAPTIWVIPTQGGLPAQICAGYSPAWSPDSKKIAYVSPEFKIFTMDADGANQQQITQGAWRDLYPVWTPPPGRHLVFASNEAQNELRLPNFDLWLIADDGSNKTPLTSNGSFDSVPTLNPDGTQLYFFSNRGGQRRDQETLQIYRIKFGGN